MYIGVYVCAYDETLMWVFLGVRIDLAESTEVTPKQASDKGESEGDRFDTVVPNFRSPCIPLGGRANAMYLGCLPAGIIRLLFVFSSVTASGNRGGYARVGDTRVLARACSRFDEIYIVKRQSIVRSR